MWIVVRDGEYEPDRVRVSVLRGLADALHSGQRLRIPFVPVRLARPGVTLGLLAGAPAATSLLARRASDDRLHAAWRVLDADHSPGTRQNRPNGSTVKSIRT